MIEEQYMKYMFKPIQPAPRPHPIIKKTEKALQDIFSLLPIRTSQTRPVLLFINRCTQFLDQQRLENPRTFVPHGAKHSYDVYKYAKSDLDSIPSTKGKELEIMVGLPLNIIKFTLELSTLLHDIGYPDQKRKGFQKCNHGPEGAKLFDTIASQLSDILKNVGYSENTATLVPTTISKLIRFHGADKIDYLAQFNYQGKDLILSKKRKFLETAQPLALPIFGRYFDRISFKDNQLGMPCIIPTSLDTLSSTSERLFNFCIGKIRQYDNNDSTKSRLTDTQRRIIDRVCSKIKVEDATHTPIEDLELPKIVLRTSEESEFYAILGKQEQRKYFFGQFATESLSIEKKAGCRIIINTCYNSKFENLF